MSNKHGPLDPPRQPRTVDNAMLEAALSFAASAAQISLAADRITAQLESLEALIRSFQAGGQR